MASFLIALGLVLLAIGGLSLGVLFGRSPIKGSCGGLACIPGTQCGACTRRRDRDGEDPA